MGRPPTESLHIARLSRVASRGGIDLAITADRCSEARLSLSEPPRLLEKVLEGYGYDQAVDAVARFCGSCPIAYQLTAAQAFERLFQVEPPPWIEALRRVLHCAEWLRSHARHIHLFAAPDFLGAADALALAGAGHGEVIHRGLRLQALGADVLRLFGGRSIHALGIRVGGFYSVPAAGDVAALLERLAAAIADAEDLVRWTASFAFPDDTQPFTSVALSHPREYAIGAGRIQSGDGLDIPASQFEKHFAVRQVPHSTRPQLRLDGRPYLVGPLARLNLNFRELPPVVRVVLDTLPIAVPSHNMFHSVVARAVELLLAVHEAHRLLRDYATPDTLAVPVQPAAGTAIAASEAPGGLLWLRFEVDSRGVVRQARVVPPTSQNQGRCEEDLAAALERYGLAHTSAELLHHAARVVRNYDL